MTDFRPTRFEILPTVIKNLLIINVLVFVAQIIIDGVSSDIELETKIGTITNYFALHSIQSPLFKPWQIITHMFMHGSLLHILFNMYALWMFGSILENVWGPKKFMIFYLVCGIGAAICHMTVLYFDIESIARDAVNNPNLQGELIQKLFEPTVGASGAIFGCLAGFGYLFPNTSMYIILVPVPIKAKWLVLIYAGIELTNAIRNSAGDNVAHFAHLGGALMGFLLVFFWNKTNKKTLF